MPKFDLKANHAINLGMIIVGILLVFYNHWRSGTSDPLTLDDFMILAPMAGQYAAAVKAHLQESPRYITARQLLTLLEMCEERGIDARAWALENYNVRVDVLTRQQATASIVKLKKIPRKEIDQ